jgi:hypothetical protein
MSSCTIEEPSSKLGRLYEDKRRQIAQSCSTLCNVKAVRATRRGAIVLAGLCNRRKMSFHGCRAWHSCTAWQYNYFPPTSRKPACFVFPRNSRHFDRYKHRFYYAKGRSRQPSGLELSAYYPDNQVDLGFDGFGERCNGRTLLRFLRS